MGLRRRLRQLLLLLDEAAEDLFLGEGVRVEPSFLDRAVQLVEHGQVAHEHGQLGGGRGRAGKGRREWGGLISAHRPSGEDRPPRLG